jgi:hypothetical protein
MKVVLSSKMPTNSFTSLKMTTKYIKMGRGARNQRDAYHQSFLDEKDRLRPQYRLCRTHQEKRRVQQMLLDWVQQTEGKFVKESPTDKKVLVVVTDQKKLLQKAAQTLREPRKRVVSQAILTTMAIPLPDHRPPLKKEGNSMLLKSYLQVKGSDLRFDPENVRERPVIKNEVLPDTFYQVTGAKSIVLARLELYPASKAVHPTAPVPPIDPYHLKHVCNDGWSEKEDDFEFFQDNWDIEPLGSPDLVDEHDTIVPLNDSSDARCHVVDEAPRINAIAHLVPENIDVDFYMNLSDDDLWSLAKELLND